MSLESDTQCHCKFIVRIQYIAFKQVIFIVNILATVKLLLFSFSYMYMYNNKVVDTLIYYSYLNILCTSGDLRS